MPKGYWIAHVDVSDPEAYRAYAAANNEILPKWGGRFVVRAGQSEVMEGALRSRHVVIEFPDYASARACYESDEYKANMARRTPVSTADMVIVEGWDG